MATTEGYRPVLERDRLASTEEVIASNPYLNMWRRGEFDLRWRDAQFEHAKAQISRRGLTMRDIAIGKYGEIPDHVPHRVMAGRGSVLADTMPDLGYDLNSKADFWAENVMELYEEAKVRQWNASTDIPWADLQQTPISTDLELAMSQMCTFLTQVEMVAADLPAKWMWRMNHAYVEAKMFLTTQCMDESRHAEVFRKRALVNGGGLIYADPYVEEVLGTIIGAPSWHEASAALHLLGEGLVLDIFRAGEFIAPTDVDKKIFRMCMQDEARHVAYGTLHIKTLLEEDPAREKELDRSLDYLERVVINLIFSPTLIEPVVILLAGGIENARETGYSLLQMFWRKVVDEYLHRCDRVGYGRRAKTTLPLELPEVA